MLRGWPSFPEHLPDFDTAAAPEVPQELFLAWLTDAGEHGFAPHAATLSTVDSEGAPDARVLIIKDVDDAGWYVATSALSPKGRQLSGCPQVALTFFWPQRGRQVRIRGTAHAMPPEVSAADFLQRPPASRVEAMIGNQSEVLVDERDLWRAAEQAQRRVQDDPDFVPESWTRYLVAPRTVEFWQARHDRRHMRLRYTSKAADEGWRRDRLWP